MSTSEYRRGWEDHAAMQGLQNAALNGPDRTLYECVGGPKHGERIETGGGLEFRVMLPREPITAKWMSYDPLRPPSSIDLIGTGTYRRVHVVPTRAPYPPRTIYVWQGADR